MRRRVVSLAFLISACAGASRSPDPRADACAAQICESDDAGCDAVVLDDVWIWDGRACVEAYASGCGVVGADCAELYASKPDCETAWSACIVGS